jgi:putative oxidoreductase
MKKNLVLETILALIIFLFLYSSLNKLMDMRTFARDMGHQPFPKWSKPYLIWIVPLSELTISLLLLADTLPSLIRKQPGEHTRKILRRGRIIALWGTSILMCIFTIYTTAAVLQLFEDIPCSCGGVIRNLSWPQHLALNLFYMAISLYGLSICKKLRDRGIPAPSALNTRINLQKRRI